MGYFYSIVNTCASKWARNGKLKLKLERPEKKIRVYDAQTCKNATPAEKPEKVRDFGLKASKTG